MLNPPDRRGSLCFVRDYKAYRAWGVRSGGEPKKAPYRTVAVFEDLYGNLWDLVQFA